MRHNHKNCHRLYYEMMAMMMIMNGIGDDEAIGALYNFDILPSPKESFQTYFTCMKKKFRSLKWYSWCTPPQIHGTPQSFPNHPYLILYLFGKITSL